MDGNAMMGRDPVEMNREALKRIVAGLVAMASLAGGASTLPRHLYRAILRLLRPAESAARRLIIAAARGIVVALPPPRPRKTRPKPNLIATERFLRRLGIAVMLSHEDDARLAAEKRVAALRAARPRGLSLPLLDPLKRPFRPYRRYTPAHAAPRILSLDGPFIPLPPPPSPDDPVSAARLTLRLEVLGRALDDLPGQAQRFARWKARNDAALARDRQDRDAAVAQGKHGAGAVPFRRASPLRRGRPPGGRLSRYDPDARRRSNIRDVDEILAHCHALAQYALDPPRPDTS